MGATARLRHGRAKLGVRATGDVIFVEEEARAHRNSAAPVAFMTAAAIAGFWHLRGVERKRRRRRRPRYVR